MAAEYANDHLSLTMYLNLQMLDAIDDLAATGAPIPPDLFDRFLGWPRVLPAAAAGAEMPRSRRLRPGKMPRSA